MRTMCYAIMFMRCEFRLTGEIFAMHHVSEGRRCGWTICSSRVFQTTNQNWFS